MSRESSEQTRLAEQLSALLDGELEGVAVSRTCAAWRDEAGARELWHSYHLIGDVLRSDDLAAAPQRDAAFLSRLRARLADEPVVLAPQPLAASVAPEAPEAPLRAVAGARVMRRHWRASAAVAAGFVAVAGVLVATRAPVPVVAQAPTGIVAPAVLGAVPVVATVEPRAEPAELVTDGRVIRDARIDRYLAAHQQFAGTSASGLPSAFLRSATATDTSRR